MTEKTTLLRVNIEKTLAAIALVEASLAKLPLYDAKRLYTPDEREPYDALADRFIRVVETSIRCFRSYERYSEAATSDTLRDLLNRMEKNGLITSTSRWMTMRDVRNRIVHDYIPDQVRAMYDQIQGEFGKELAKLKSKLTELKQAFDEE